MSRDGYVDGYERAARVSAKRKALTLGVERRDLFERTFERLRRVATTAAMSLSASISPPRPPPHRLDRRFARSFTMCFERPGAPRAELHRVRAAEARRRRPVGHRRRRFQRAGELGVGADERRGGTHGDVFRARVSVLVLGEVQRVRSVGSVFRVFFPALPGGMGATLFFSVRRRVSNRVAFAFFT